MFECTTNSYETLYARWLENPGTLLDWGGYDVAKHTRMLDLCGGTGAVSQEALRRGATRVWLLDLNPRTADKRIVTICDRAESLLGGPFDAFSPFGWEGDLRGTPLFDFVVCRQALGYLDLPKVAKALASVMAPGADFVCNAFIKPKWALRPYRYNERWFLEASGFLGRKVFHLQVTATDFDVTVFRWHSGDEVVDAFSDDFTLQKLDASATSLKFLFRRKPNGVGLRY